MELNDCAFPLLEKIICTDNQEEVKNLLVLNIIRGLRMLIMSF